MKNNHIDPIESKYDTEDTKSKEPLFYYDDYYEVQNSYFSEIIKNNDWFASPGGWVNPDSIVSNYYEPLTLSPDDLQKYALDEGSYLGDKKEKILEVLSMWENRKLHWDNVTLFPSVSTAALGILISLKERGYKNIIFESPCYFGTLSQATLLGFNLIRIPSYLSEGFNVDPRIYIDAIDNPESCVVWFTHPRFGIGINQDRMFIENIANKISSKTILVLDEASEQNFPSTFSGIELDFPNIIRIRGYFKGLGLNGLKIAFSLHDASERRELVGVLDAVGASLDQHSLISAGAFSNKINYFRLMLAYAQNQVKMYRESLETMCKHPNVYPTKVTNGYLGSIIVDFTKLNADFAVNRRLLLEKCKNRKVPIIPKASIGFAIDTSYEAIRINYFTSQDNIKKTVTCLNEIYQELRDLN